MIAQDVQQVEVFRREAAGWRSQVLGTGNPVTLVLIGLVIAIADRDRGTDVSPQAIAE